MFVVVVEVAYFTAQNHTVSQTLKINHRGDTTNRAKIFWFKNGFTGLMVGRRSKRRC